MERSSLSAVSVGVGDCNTPFLHTLSAVMCGPPRKALPSLILTAVGRALPFPRGSEAVVLGTAVPTSAARIHSDSLCVPLKTPSEAVHL